MGGGLLIVRGGVFRCYYLKYASESEVFYIVCFKYEEKEIRPESTKKPYQ